MAPVSDALALRDLVDGVVLVYRLGYTPHTLFRQALEDVGEKKLIGVLLNGWRQQSEALLPQVLREILREVVSRRPRCCPKNHTGSATSLSWPTSPVTILVFLLAFWIRETFVRDDPADFLSHVAFCRS